MWKKEEFASPVCPHFPWQAHRFCPWAIPSMMLKPTYSGFQDGLKTHQSVGFPWDSSTRWGQLRRQSHGLTTARSLAFLSGDSHCLSTQTRGMQHSNMSCVCVCVHMHVCVCACARVRAHTYVYVCIGVYMCTQYLVHWVLQWYYF